MKRALLGLTFLVACGARSPRPDIGRRSGRRRQAAGALGGTPLPTWPRLLAHDSVVSRAPKRPSASPRSRPLVISGIRPADCCTVIVPKRGDCDAEISPGGQRAGPLVYVTGSSMGRRFVLGMASMGRSGPEFPFGLDRAREVLAGCRSQGVMEPSTWGRLLHGCRRRNHALHDVSEGAG